MGKYSVKHYQKGRWEEIVIIESDGSQPFSWVNPLDWHGKTTPPADTSPCGYDGAVCRSE